MANSRGHFVLLFKLRFVLGVSQPHSSASGWQMLILIFSLPLPTKRFLVDPKKFIFLLSAPVGYLLMSV